MPDASPARTSPVPAPAVWLVVALAWHGLWALSTGTPTDLDAQYYLLVARHLAAGDGAVTASLWNLSILPDQLPLPADLHWMPLPSRVIVPEVSLVPGSHGALTQAVMAALLAPLAWWLAATLSDRPALPHLAAGIATAGSVWVRLWVVPDTYALYALLGAIGWMAAQRQRVLSACAVGAAAALTRNDGLLLSLCLAVAFPWRAAIAVALSGPAAGAAWMARNTLVAGDAYWEARRILSGSAEYLSLYDGIAHDPLTLTTRLAAAWDALPKVFEYWVSPGLVLLTVPTVIGAWAHRDRGWVRAAAAYWIVPPLIGIVVSPAIVAHGTLYRSGTALWIAHAALAASGLLALGDWGHRVRGYPRVFLPAVLTGAYALVVLSLGSQRAADPGKPSECARVDPLPPGPVFTSQPLAMALSCGRPGVMMSRRTPPETLDHVAAAYGVRFAVTWPGDQADEATLPTEDVPARMPTWRPIGDGLWAVPEGDAF